ncbi:MAG: tRNA (N(6)-L-threonylcarbamoyladenosine(37)-C(2))-methylthiotransferase MtaB, partial [Fidelibacterota bacterium]
GVVSPEERARRSKLLHSLSDEKRKCFYRKNVGDTASVLFEEFRKGMLSGLTENYVRVRVLGTESLVNEVREVKLVAEGDGYLQGELWN